MPVPLVPSTTLPASGTCAYNTVNFDGLIKTKAMAKPIYDASGRMVKHIQHTFDVHATIAPGVDQDGNVINTNQSLSTIRNLLTAPGKTLLYDQKGYGTFRVNEEGGKVFDVAWGPKPQILSFVPIGRENACAIDWQVTTCIPECGPYYANKLMEACWEVDYAIGHDGLTTITTTGLLSIPLSLRNGSKLLDNADIYREMIAFVVPEGFQRTQSYHLSMDRSQLRFTIIDKQLPVAFPDGVVEINITHSITNTSPIVIDRGPWSARFDGTIKMSPTYPKSFAWDRFVAITSKRILNALGLAYPNPAGKLIPLTVIPTKLDIKEDLFGLGSSFSLNYQILGCPLNKILDVAGMWQPLDTDWLTWQESLGRNAQSVRGTLRVAFANDDETILDLCTVGVRKAQPLSGAEKQTPPDPSINDRPLQTTESLTGADAINARGVVYGADNIEPTNTGDNIPFDPEATWIDYSVHLVMDENDHIVRHKPLAGNIKITTPSGNSQSGNLPSIGRVAASVGIDQAVVTSDTPDIIQRMVAPTTRVRLVGEAVRIGYPIEIPRLTIFQGGPAVQKRQRVTSNKVVGNMGGFPIIARMWDIEYEVTVKKPTIPIPANPLTYTDSAQG